MYSIFKNIIENRDFKLGRLISKIKKAWGEDELTEQQMNELIALAREKADASSEIGIAEVLEMYKLLEERVTALEENKTPTQSTEEYKPYIPNYVYNKGDKIMFNGRKYICIYYPCNWSPTEYPQGWKEIN